MNVIVTSFFTQNGVPVTGLIPTIRIWDVEDASETLVIPSSGPDPSMSEVGDGFYKYVFTTFDPTKTYVTRTDGGVTITNPGERFQTSNIDLTETAGSTTITPADVTAIVDGVWDETASNHLIVGSMGAYQNETHADAQQLRIDVTTAISIVTTLLKYESNRTKIDKVAKTLTVYDNDGVSPLEVFDLKDSTGAPSVTEVCERVPQ